MNKGQATQCMYGAGLRGRWLSVSVGQEAQYG